MLRSKCFLESSKKLGDVSAVGTVRMIESDMEINKINDFFTETLIQEITNELHLDLQKRILLVSLLYQKFLQQSS